MMKIDRGDVVTLDGHGDKLFLVNDISYDSRDRSILELTRLTTTQDASSLAPTWSQFSWFREDADVTGVVLKRYDILMRELPDET